METLSSDKINSTHRLTQLVRPVNYRVKLHPNLKVGIFNGSVNILVNVKEKSSNITLHSNALSIQDVSITKGNEAVEVSRYCEIKELEQLRIETRDLLSEGDYCLSIQFSGDLKNKIVGFYSSEYKDRVMVSSKFQPTYARQAFPCFDEPDFKATFDITLVKPASYVALSNMNEISSVHDPTTNTDMVTFARSVPMSTYLVCFVLCEFAYKEVEINTNGVGENFKLRAYAQEEELHKIEFALDIAKRATEFYINYYQVPYPLPKLDMIAIPNYISGATEHWGLVTFRETSFLLAPAAAAHSRLAVAHTVAHELAHMWFGNLVTMKWWDDIWLNEGFASYMEVKCLDSLEPTWNMWEQFVSQKVPAVLALDGSGGGRPLVQAAATPDQITALFDAIAYTKGASVVRMLEGLAGPEPFRRGVGAYLQQHQFGTCGTEDLLAALQPHHALPLSAVMRAWTTQAGYPLVTATLAEGGSRVHLTQARFFSDPGSHQDPHSDRWYIPITYKTNLGDAEEIVWFPDSKDSVSLPLPEGASWLKVNNEQQGYYRVSYGEGLWARLSRPVRRRDPALSTADRAQLVSEAFALAEAGVVQYARPLALCEDALTGERAAAVWGAAAAPLARLARLLPRAAAPLHKFMEPLILPIYKEMSWEPSALSVPQRVLRVKVLSLALQHAVGDAEAQARRRFAGWLRAHGSAHPHTVEPDLRALVYTYGIKTSGREEWERTWSIYLQETDAQEKATLRSALAASNDTEILHRYLSLAWDEKQVRSQDYLGVVQSASESAGGAQCAWQAVRSRWPDLVRRFSLNSRYLGGVIPAVTAAFATDDRLKEMEAFFSEQPEAGAGAEGRRRALLAVRANVAWRARSERPLLHWLQHHRRQTPAADH